MKLVPFGWVAFFIFLYILLIGPGDYFLLKKVFKRMELTWITFPAIVLAVSALAYIAAYAVKGRELRINKVDVLDVDQTSGMVRGTSVVNLFSPQNRDYGVSFVPLPMDQAPPEKPSKSTGAEVLTSWMGTPENQFGGMGNSGRMGFSSGGYSAEPVGSSERLEGVRVAIWSTKSLTSRWYGPSPNLVEADLLPSGIDRLTGTVVNRLPIPLEDAILVFGRQVYQIGDMAPNVVIRVELTKDRYLSGLLGEAPSITSTIRIRLRSKKSSTVPTYSSASCSTTAVILAPKYPRRTRCSAHSICPVSSRLAGRCSSASSSVPRPRSFLITLA